MASSDDNNNNNNNDIVTDLYPFYRLYKYGHVEHFYELPDKTSALPGAIEVPLSLEDPATGISSKDVSITAHVSARLYLQKITEPNQKLPILVYYHGGALVLGSVFFKVNHLILNCLVSKSNCVAISVNYRLAPEHDVPTILQDCWDALQWVASHAIADTVSKDPWIENYGDFNRLFVAGDSAGGTLAYNMVMRVGTEKLMGDMKILGAILGCPYFLIPSIENIKHTLFYKLLNTICPLSEWGNDSPVVNPVLEKGPRLDKVGCLRIFLITMEMDELVLKGTGIAFVEVVKKSGWKGEIEFVKVEGEPHCFYANIKAQKSIDLINRIASFIQRKQHVS